MDDADAAATQADHDEGMHWSLGYWSVAAVLAGVCCIVCVQGPCHFGFLLMLLQCSAI